MKLSKNISILIAVFVCATAFFSLRLVRAQNDESAESAAPTAPDAVLGSGITYQGSLADSGSLANGSYDIYFQLMDAPTGGSVVGIPTQKNSVAVTNGLFSAENIDFGTSGFTGKAVWLELRVRPSGGSNFTTLSPRQSINAAPYAVGLKPGAIIAAAINTSLSLENQSTSGTVYGLNALSQSTSGAAVYGRSTATSGSSYGVYGYARSLDSAGVRANNAVDFGVDLVLSGHANTTRGDDGRISSDPNYAGSDLMMLSNDGVFAYLDSDGNETGEFEVYDGDEASIFSVNEDRFMALRDSAGQIILRANSNREFSIYEADGTETIEMIPSEGDTGGQIVLRDAAGNTTITLDAEFGAGGNGRITTEVVEITGGSDLSEQFDVNSDAGDPLPGMVVSIDADNPGQLIVSTAAYDRKVAGIISGAGDVQPGLLMGQRDTMADGEHPVALTGRVYVYADASNGAIEPGDLLTTSDTAGHVMKVTDYAQAQGAIIGKAMESLDSGTGLILVLVALQ